MKRQACFVLAGSGLTEVNTGCRLWVQVREGVDFVSRLQTENLWVVVLEKMRQGLG